MSETHDEIAMWRAINGVSTYKKGGIGGVVAEGDR
jgi:hypothetical protein